AQSSDALVIVVSEETGNIIVAKGNEVIDIHDIQVLRHNLRRHLGIDREPIKGIKRETMELAAVGLVCLICMTGVWFSFTKAMETLRTIEVPVEFANRGEDHHIYGTSASSINLYLIGAGALIKNIRLDQLAVSVDLGGARIGENTFHLSRKNVILPPGIRLNRMEPTVLRVKLDKLTAKQVPVQVNWVGRLPEGMRIVSASLSPSTIRLAGPSQELEAADTVYTVDVDISGFRTSGTFFTRLQLDPPSLQVEETEGEQIEVAYTMGERIPL
ncbi:MAG: CdaR family protein, partial [Desulfosalsimonas sp.]